MRRDDVGLDLVECFEENRRSIIGVRPLDYGKTLYYSAPPNPANCCCDCWNSCNCQSPIDCVY